MLNVLVGYAQPTNIDFNSGNINGWTLEEGSNLGSTSMSIGSIHTSTQYTVLSSGSPEINSVPVTMMSPLGGNFVRIGQTAFGGITYKFTRTYTVSASSANVQFAYALVMDNGGHTCDEQNYFVLSVKDASGNTIPANANNKSILNSTSCSSGDPSYSTYLNFGYKNWNNVSYNLSNFMGTAVTIELLVSGCHVAQGAHAGYAYFDANFCNNSFAPEVMSVNTNTYSLVSSQNSISICGTNTATIFAPPGANSYSWTGSGITGLTSQSVTVSQTGTYQLVFDKPTGCSNTTSVTIKVGDIPTVSITAPSGTLCAYAGITLSASGASSYVWLPNASNSTGNFLANNTVYPPASTVYTVIGTNIYGCSGSAQYSVNIVSSPSLALTGNTLICPGNSASLTISGADTYSWSTGVTTVSVALSPTVNTNYNVKGFTTSTGCSQTLPFTVAMDGIVTYSPNILKICAGDSMTIAASGATSYTWSSGANTNTINVKPLSTTSYTLNATTACGIKQSVYTLTVNPLPSIPITQVTTPVCGGAMASFTTTYLSSNNYTWSSGSTSYASSFTPTVSLTSYSNSISVRATNLAGCTSTNTLIYTVYPIPTVVTSLSSGICVNDTSLLIANGASTYTWNPGGIVSNSVVISPTVSTTYSVIGASIDGCKNSQTLTVGVSGSSSLIATVNPSITCSGKTTTLTVNGNGSMRWYISDTTSQYVSSSLTYITPTLSVGSYTYYVSSTCSNYSVRIPVTFTVSANPTITVPSTVTMVCANTPFQIAATGANTYTWTSPSPYLYQVNDTVTASLPAYTNAGFNVTGTDINGCVGTNSVLVKVWGDQPINIISTPSIVCVGTPAVLSLTGATSYTWSTGIVSNTTVVTPTTTSVSYSVNLINTLGCQQSNYVYLNIVAKPTISVTYSGSVSNTTLCAGSTQTLFASGAATYTWNSGITTSSISVSPTVTTNYTVTGEAAGLPGCSTTAVKTITVYAQPSTQITANKDTICMGSALSMTATGATSYSWSTGITSNVYSVSSFTSPTSYTVTGTNSFGCKKTVTKNIEVYTISQVTAVATPSAVCYGQTTTISAIGVPNYTIVGYGAPYNTPKVVYPQWTPPNIYSIDGRDSHGCVSSSYVNVPTNYTSFFYTDVYNSAYSTTVCAGTNVTLATSTPSLSYVWLPGNFTNDTIIVTPSVSTVYTVTGTNGTCAYTNTVAITTKPSPTVSVVSNGTVTCANQATLTATASPSVTYSWHYMNGSPFGSTTYTTLVSSGSPVYCLVTSTTNSCVGTATVTSPINVYGPTFTYTAPPSICIGESAQITASGAASYNFNYSGINANSTFTVSPSTTTTYTLWGIGTNSCVTVLNPTIVVNSNPTVSISGNSTVCEGSSTSITASGADTYSWSTGANTPSVNIIPLAGQVYTVTGTELTNNCSATQTVMANVDVTCADVWPGDANSDGVADNLDVLELGLHYTQTGAPRASVSNNWQSYYANSWGGTITNGKNLSHSDCNGDGTINDNDTLAIFNNYNLIHAFRPAQTNTFTATINIVPDQSAVVKGTWGTASVYLGDVITSANDINGVAFTLDFDNTLIEPNNIYIEYQNSFMDAAQNLYFRKQNFVNGKIYTASTHTVSNNVSGYGKIATVHYQILSSLATDEILNIGISQGYKSNASGIIESLATNTGTLMALGASVGIKEDLINGNVFIYPSPTNGLLNINFTTAPLNTKIEIYSTLGSLVTQEILSDKNNTINISNLSSAVYYMKVLVGNKVVAVKKIIRE